MAVDPLRPIDPVAASPSTEARVVAEIEEAMKIVNRSPAVRAELVADIKAKLRDPEYLSATVLDRIAERMQDRFGT